MRLKIVKFLFLIIFSIIILRLFYWQIINFDDLSARAEQQHLVSRATEGVRGSILFSDGSILASNKLSFLLYGLPQIIQDKKNTALKLVNIIKKNADFNLQDDPSEEIKYKEDLIFKLSQDLEWTALEKNIDLATKKEIEKLDIKGLSFDNESSRYYPEASMAAHLLGFVGSDPMGRQTGYFGLEGYYNGQLKGTRGAVTEEKDARGFPILMGKFLKRESRDGHNIILNIDRTIQYIVEKKLKEDTEKFGAKMGSVVVMEPATGAILAMASYPSYDPKNFTKTPKEYFKNPVVADSYEPGSTFKVLVMAAALNENLVKVDTKCDICSGPIQIANYSIKTWNDKYIPDINMVDTIVHSDNTGMVFVGRKLGIDKFYQYFQNFGFGSLTGIDLQDETSTDLRPKVAWREIDLATASFGQGIAVSAIGMVRALGAIANGGNLMEPHIVKAIQNNDKVIEIKPKVISTPINARTAKIITEMMVEAVQNGEAKVFAPLNFKIAGKTGTAQIPVAGHYDPTKTIASFVGFAPADDPKFVMLVRYNEPSSSIFGAETAAPTFFEIAKDLLFYFNVSPK